MIYLNNNNILFTVTKKKYIQQDTNIFDNYENFENLYYIAFAQYKETLFVGLSSTINI